MTFGETQRYESGNTSSADAQWRSLVPRTHQGYVRLGPDRRVFALAMFHELHCMATFHRALVWHEHPDANPGHFQHCLNYLRQLFMCAADTTLEPYDFMTQDYSIGRAGVTRQCRDWSMVYREADDNWTGWFAYASAINHTALSGLSENWD
ncbi:hypothetical protein K488DRAFT_80864 [Vararia minispora EC-137]|uniref:Uncharacterized protein n=1 Tax=Vararia minispora EC-137 TaxID=1314806 RepID=A0ACB8Q910_9AGAM|nr:hypothetical protein K488DRAFT_80864 [Vararia minispora EC-137]